LKFLLSSYRKQAGTGELQVSGDMRHRRGFESKMMLLFCSYQRGFKSRCGKIRQPAENTADFDAKVSRYGQTPL
jgi:hypothetical protein